MKFKYDPKKGGYVRSPNGTLSLPKASPGLASVPGLKITPKTRVLPASPGTGIGGYLRLPSDKPKP